MSFSGSYAPEDVQFLLKPVRLASTEIEEKERLIQSGAKHYSELISRESPPNDEYLEFFHRALKQNRRMFASHILQLARHLSATQKHSLVLVSLARAGTPIGVLLKRTLRHLQNESTYHYSVSIIRDRGIDLVALEYILERHSPEEIVFVDGWTGKGAIARELTVSIQRINTSRRLQLADSMHVVSDLCGVARFAASSGDYLIPSSILNATVSGLVSRTILNSESVSPGDFHACLYYEEFESIDLSRWFIDTIMTDVVELLNDPAGDDPSPWTPESCNQLQATSGRFISEMCHRYPRLEPNHIKPGIGETSRALLRRVPSRVLIRNEEDEDVVHILWLAGRRNVPVETVPRLPYKAVALLA
jgi:hypothetical protein